jgi:hypothetical protein
MPKVSKLGITTSQYEDKNAYQRAYRKLHPDCEKKYRNIEKARETAWKRRYGITREDYNLLLGSQKNCCAICKTETVGRNHTYFHVDHDHNTGRVRGLLCDKCNRGLGYFEDDSFLLERASIYLK